MSTITQILGLYKDALSEPSPFNVFGIECEIESVYSDSDTNRDIWTPKTDGSLRNNGMEYVSVPLTKGDALQAFKSLHEDLLFRNKDEKFSPRTSIHVHVNCKNLTAEQTKNILLYYALFEEVFFSLVHPSRRDNIHCVALSDTHLPSRYNQDIISLHSIWSKYTAFNLKPLNNYGTIEFRHSDGHDDVNRFSEWLSAIDNLVTLSKTSTLSAETLEKDNVERWFDTIFGHCDDYRDLKMTLPTLIQNSLIDIKLSFI